MGKPTRLSGSRRLSHHVTPALSGSDPSAIPTHAAHCPPVSGRVWNTSPPSWTMATCMATRRRKSRRKSGFRHPREDVVSTVHRSTVDLVRELHQDERVKHQGVVHGRGVARYAPGGVEKVEERLLRRNPIDSTAPGRSPLSRSGRRRGRRRTRRGFPSPRAGTQPARRCSSAFGSRRWARRMISAAWTKVLRPGSRSPAPAASESIMRFSHSICTAVSGDSPTTGRRRTPWSPRRRSR